MTYVLLGIMGGILCASPSNEAPVTEGVVVSISYSRVVDVVGVIQTPLQCVQDWWSFSKVSLVGVGFFLDQEDSTMVFEDLLAFWWSFKTIKHFFARKKNSSSLPLSFFEYWAMMTSQWRQMENKSSEQMCLWLWSIKYKIICLH